MRLRPRPIWVLALAALGLLILLNRMSVQTLNAADALSMKQRKELFRRIEKLEAKVRDLEQREAR